MGMITIQKDENIRKIRSRMMRGLRSVKALSVQKYSGRLTLKEDPMAYQKRVRQEWNEHTD